MNRCFWVDEKSEIYVKYHDEEWGVPKYDDRMLFELLILESFQAGLSWLTVLKKREDFRKAFDNFDVLKVANYDDNKVNELLNNEKIIRSRGKISASINNAKIEYLQKQIDTSMYSNRNLLITSKVPVVTKVLQEEKENISSYEMMVDSYITKVDEYCNGRFKWESLKRKLVYSHFTGLIST